MQYFDFQNLISATGILFLLLLISFSFYLPLKYWFSDKKIVLASVIPVSISFMLLFGYVFYSTPYIKWFPLSYLAAIIAINLYFIFRLWPNRIKKAKNKLNLADILSWFFLLIPLIYTRFYDSVLFTGPGNNDTFNHIFFLNDLDRIGYISNSYYAPGLQLLFYPIKQLIPATEIYRFGGPALGLIIILAIFLIMSSWIKNKWILRFFILLSCFPIFNQFTLQTISFFSSSLSFILFLSFIRLKTEQGLNLKAKVLLFVLYVAALSITVPYLFVQLLITQFVLLIISSILKNKLIFKEQFNINRAFFAILLMGLGLAFAHIILQTRILDRGEKSFPAIPIVSETNGTTKISSNQSIDNKDLIQSFLTEYSFSKNYILPMYNSGNEIIKIKNIRKPNNILSIGSYIWIILSIFIFFFSLKKRNLTLLYLSIYSIIFGFITQTGSMEMSFYRGRSGWYLLLLALAGFTALIDLNFKKIPKNLITPIMVGAYIAAFINPPIFYRWYYPEIYDFGYNIQTHDENLTIISSQDQITLLSKKITVLPFDVKSIQKISTKDAYVIVEKNYLESDPVLSQKAYSNDENFEDFNSREKALKESFDKNKKDILSEIEGKSIVVKETNNLIIYQIKNRLNNL